MPWSVQVCTVSRATKSCTPFKAMPVRVCRFICYSTICMDVSLPVINNVSPNAGSTVGGTTLTIAGNFFSDSSNYPLVVKVSGQPCNILSSDGSTITCQTPVAPSSIPARSQGSCNAKIHFFLTLTLR